MMKAQELRSKSKSELKDLLLSLLQEQFQMRMRKGTTENQNPKTHLFLNARKDIARIKTILKQAEQSN